MPNPTLQLRPLDVRGASPVEYAALTAHINALRQERLPDDPPIPLAESIANLQSTPPFVDLHAWGIWQAQPEPEPAVMAARGYVAILRMEGNQHLAQFEITVLPAYRRQGLGRQLLQQVATVAQQEQRRMLLTNSTDRIPAGAAFLMRMGAVKGLETHTNQLRLAELDQTLLTRWLAKGAENSTDFELGFWDGAYPEEQLAAVVELLEVVNQQPRGTLDIEDTHITPAELRQIEKNLFARGSQRWTYYLTDRATGKFAGFTETVWNPNRPELLQQEMTGVFPQYRNRGLGLWLKAAMLAKVLQDRPTVKYIRTGNADSNAAMLKINTALGFKPYTAEALWQVETQTALAYLQNSA